MSAAVKIDPATPKDALVSVALWSAGLAWLMPMMGAMTALSAVVHPERTDLLSRVYTRGQIALTGSRWRAVVHPDVDANAAYVFAQNHTNHFDHVLLYDATPHFKQGLELASHFDYPIYGWFMKKRGTIPVLPGKQGQSAEIMDRMRAEVAAGHSILGFPEGTRTVTGRVGKFRSGMFFIARDLGVPVVPVAVTGAYEMMRKGSWIIRPGHQITVWVEKPLPTAGLSDAQVIELAHEAQRVVSSRVDAYWAERKMLPEEA